MLGPNKNKTDHIDGLFNGNDMKKTAQKSSYKDSFVFGQEEQGIVKNDTQEHNLKKHFETVYANEFVKFKHALRLH